MTDSYCARQWDGCTHICYETRRNAGPSVSPTIVSLTLPPPQHWLEKQLQGEKIAKQMEQQRERREAARQGSATGRALHGLPEAEGLSGTPGRAAGQDSATGRVLHSLSGAIGLPGATESTTVGVATAHIATVQHENMPHLQPASRQLRTAQRQQRQEGLLPERLRVHPDHWQAWQARQPHLPGREKNWAMLDPLALPEGARPQGLLPGKQAQDLGRGVAVVLYSFMPCVKVRECEGAWAGGGEARADRGSGEGRGSM